MNFKRLADVDVHGKRVFIRADLNVPQDDAGNVTDDTRIRASVPAIARRAVARRGGDGDVAPRAALPKANGSPRIRWRRSRRVLSELLGHRRAAHPRLGGRRRVARESATGQLVLLENCRINKGEKKNDDDARAKNGGDCATSTSTTPSAPRIAPRRPRTASPNMRRSPAPARCSRPNSTRWARRSRIRKRPLIAIVAGAKVSTKLTILRALAAKVDALIVGGGIANTFILAAGGRIGKSLAEPDLVGGGEGDPRRLSGQGPDSRRRGRAPRSSPRRRNPSSRRSRTFNLTT